MGHQDDVTDMAQAERTGRLEPCHLPRYTAEYAKAKRLDFGDQFIDMKGVDMLGNPGPDPILANADSLACLTLMEAARDEWRVRYFELERSKAQSKKFSQDFREWRINSGRAIEQLRKDAMLAEELRLTCPKCHKVAKARFDEFETGHTRYLHDARQSCVV